MRERLDLASAPASRRRARFSLRNCALAGWLLLCLARPSVAGPPPAPAPPGLIAGVCAVVAGAAVAQLACDHHLAGLRARVDALRSPQLDAIDPLRVHFSLHDLGEYEACQAELRALLALAPLGEGRVIFHRD
jgi:hypothetical protein